jgi:UDP:flavonoid glycosyltransferase YjiC (YdhE family)
MPRETIVFAAETLNLAEVTRMVEIAKVARRSFEPVFLSYDGAGRNHAHIERHGFRVVRLEPQLDEAAVERFWKADRMESWTEDFFSAADLARRVESELALYGALRPVAVVTGFCLSVVVSARAAKVPLVWVAQSTWLDEYSRRFAGWPDFADWAPLRALPERTRNALARRLVPFGYAMWARGLNRVGRRYGLPRLAGSRMFEGDHTLFAEPEGFSEVGIPARLAGRAAFIGPLLGALDLPVPEEIERLPRDLPIVYFAMGSSGIERVVAETLQAFGGQPFRVIAPVANLLEGGPPAPPNVVVTGWIPAEKVNPLAQVSVLHGGIGTLLTACQAGTPIVGIPNGNPEQEWNLGALVRKGFAVHLHKNRLTPATIVDAVKRLLADTEAQRRARDFASVCRSWNGPENAAAYLEKHLAPRL